MVLNKPRTTSEKKSFFFFVNVKWKSFFWGKKLIHSNYCIEMNLKKKICYFKKIFKKINKSEDIAAI